MRLVSLNAWKAEGDHARRIGAMVAGLSALSPDLVALQEDLRTADGLTHTALALARALGMPLSWVPARPKLRNVGLRRTLTTSGLAVLSRQAVLEQRVLALPEDPRDGERVAQGVRLAATDGGGWLVNLHLTHLADRDDLRRQQFQAALAWASALAPEAPVLVCGDLNAPADAFAGLPGAPGRHALTDAFGGRSKVTHVTVAGEALDLDQVMLFQPVDGPSWRVRDARVVLDGPGPSGVVPSDHFGVCVDLDPC
jgi:endonuclease/exonuclease/phosphatase family metal-dependent hydrolase